MMITPVKFTSGFENFSYKQPAAVSNPAAPVDTISIGSKTFNKRDVKKYTLIGAGILLAGILIFKGKSILKLFKKKPEPVKPTEPNVPNVPTNPNVSTNTGTPAGPNSPITQNPPAKTGIPPMSKGPEKTDFQPSHTKDTTTSDIAKNQQTSVESENSINSSSAIKPKIEPEFKKPEFLYHMTTYENYQSILKDGVIKKSKPNLGDGVFLSNMEDLRGKYSKDNLKGMIDWYRGLSKSKKVVLIKIPVDSMQEGTISWRQTPLDAKRLNGVWQKFDDFSNPEFKSLHDEPLEFLYNKEIPASKIDSAKIINLNDTNKEDKDFIQKFWRRVSLPKDLADLSDYELEKYTWAGRSC